LNTYPQFEQVADRLLFDLPALETKLRKALLCSAQDARCGLIEVLKFMSLAASSTDGQLTPSHRIDLAWHELILFTRAYHQLCVTKFGMFVHHQPGGTQQENQKQFAMTLQRYEAAFGEPPRDFWGMIGEPTSACGTCESDGD
jgi:hypothetical protein